MSPRALVGRVPRWVWPAFELVTAAVVALVAGRVWLSVWQLATGMGVPVLAVWPVLVAWPAGALWRLGRDLRLTVTRWCNRRDALLDGWCSSDG
jgi:hypothetical protein